MEVALRLELEGGWAQIQASESLRGAEGEDSYGQRLRAERTICEKTLSLLE